MTTIGKLWTGAVAYIALGVGAGLSVAGNLADTYRTRGADVDGLDKVMAGGWPILVLLAIELFVSPRWSPKRMFQIWRWLGCLTVGLMAMTVSWTHLHDLMASRGQLPVVSVLGPLAIDCMAIMATGLILSTRVRTQPWPDGMVSAVESALPAVGQAVTDFFSDTASGHGRDRWSDLLATPDTDGMSDLNAWVSGQERAHADIADTLAAEAQQHLAMMVTDNTPLPHRVRTAQVSVPQEFMDMVAVWDPSALRRPDLVKLAAAHFGVSTRTASRWLAAATGRPVSGPPEKS